MSSNSAIKQLVMGGSVFVGVMGFGYLLMRWTSPSKEEMMKVG